MANSVDLLQTKVEFRSALNLLDFCVRMYVRKIRDYYVCDRFFPKNKMILAMVKI